MNTPDPQPGTDVVPLLRLLGHTSASVECAISGHSMGEAIPDGATVRVHLDGAADAAPGTAVTLLLGGDALTVHRLIWRGRSGRAAGFILTRGDGNLFCDAPQHRSDLLGTVVAVRRPGTDCWSPVPAHAAGGGAARLVSAVVQSVMRAALELSPRLAAMLKNALVLALTPLVWLRPYPAGARRTTSRLASVVRTDSR